MALTSTKQKKEIGDRLRFERERLGYTELQIAQLLGIPLETYQRFEAGETDPGIFRMPRLLPSASTSFLSLLMSATFPAWKKTFCLKSSGHFLSKAEQPYSTLLMR